MNAGNVFVDQLEKAAKELGVDLKRSGQEVAQYFDQRAAHLSTIMGEPGIDEALAAERDSVLLFAAGRSVDVADAADAQLIGIVRGALAIAVTALA